MKKHNLFLLFCMLVLGLCFAPVVKVRASVEYVIGNEGEYEGSGSVFEDVFFEAKECAASNNEYNIVITLHEDTVIESSDTLVIEEPFKIKLIGNNYRLTDGAGVSKENGMFCVTGSCGEDNQSTFSVQNTVLESAYNDVVVVNGGMFSAGNESELVTISCSAIGCAGIRIKKAYDVFLCNTEVCVPDEVYYPDGSSQGYQKTAAIFIETPVCVDSDLTGYDSWQNSEFTLWNLLNMGSFNYSDISDNTFYDRQTTCRKLSDKILGKSVTINQSNQNCGPYQEYFNIKFVAGPNNRVLGTEQVQLKSGNDGVVMTNATTDYKGMAVAEDGTDRTLLGWASSPYASAPITDFGRFSTQMFDGTHYVANGRYNSTYYGYEDIGKKTSWAYYIKHANGGNDVTLYAVFEGATPPAPTPNGDDGSPVDAIAPVPDNIITQSDTAELTIDMSRAGGTDTPIEVGREYFENVDTEGTDILRIVAAPSGTAERKAADAGKTESSEIITDEYDPETYVKEEIAVAMNTADIPDSINTLQFEVGAQTVDIPKEITSDGKRLEVRIIEKAEEDGNIYYEMPGTLGAFSKETRRSRKRIYNVVEVEVRVDNVELHDINGAGIKVKTRIPRGNEISEGGTNIVRAFNKKDAIKRKKRVPLTVTDSIWVNIDGNGYVTKVKSEKYMDDKNDDMILEATLEHLSIYGVMSEADADELIYSQMIQSGENHKFMIRVKTSDNKQKITWDPMANVDFFRVYAAREEGKFKKVAEVKRLDFLSFTKKDTGDDVYRYKVAAFKNGEKVATSVIVYGDKSQADEASQASKVKLDAKKKVLAEGDTFKLKPQISVAGGKSVDPAGYKELNGVGVRYFSTNTQIAEVSKAGRITAVHAGECEVYAFATNGTYAKIKITVGKK